MDVNSFRFGPALKNLSSPSNPAYDFGTDPFSVEAWVKTLTGGPIVGRKVADMSPDHGGFLLSVSPGKISLTSYDESTSHSLLATDINVCDGKWHHIAAVRSGDSGSIYLNGISCAVTTEGDGTPPLNVNSVDRLTIGTVDQDESFFAGYLAEVRLWNVERTSDDISNNFCRRLTPAEVTSDLVGYWSGEFGVATDFSQTRNTTSVDGQNHGASECPPIARWSPENLCLVVCGIYNCATKVQNSDTEDWTPQARVVVTSQGFVVSGDTVMQGVQVDGPCLSWPVDGNPFEASVQLFSWGSNAVYWPDQAHRPVFEGTAKLPEQDDLVLYRGVIEFVRIGSGVLLNVGTSQLMTCTNPEVSAPVTLCDANEAAEAVQSRDMFSHYDVGGIIHSDSNLALKPVDQIAGSEVLLTTPALGGSHQSWSMLTDGRIVLKGDPTLALSAGTPDDDGVRPVIIETTNPTDLNQRWLSLGNSQYVWNSFASNAVLASVDSGVVGVQAKADGLAGQTWYIVDSSFICASSAKALTVAGEVGSELQLQPWVPGDSKQQFTYINREIVHVATGLILVMEGDLTNGKVILANPSTDSKESRWSILPGSPAKDDESNMTKLMTVRLAENSSSRSQRVKRETTTSGTNTLGDPAYGLAAAGLATYVVSITTANFNFAGTDDIVKISLENKIMGESLPLTELKYNNTRTDPFEKGKRDDFVLSNMKDIGAITGVTFEIAKQGYFFYDDWSVVGISVLNTKWRTTSLWKPQQLDKNRAYLTMSDKISISMLLPPHGKYSCTMILGMAPAQDKIGKKFGWDHTWIEVIDKTADRIPTFFDCAGGHRGEGTRSLDMGICDRNDVVRMSTGDNIDSEHPLKAAYGTNLTNGDENAGVRCDGKVKWDGQCHQIANRYLRTCIPPTSIDDLDVLPNGYGLSTFLFGKYGIGFDELSFERGFGHVEDEDYTRFMYWWQKSVGPISDRAKKAYAFIMELRKNTIEQVVEGDAVGGFIVKLRSSGISSEEIAKLTNLTEDRVLELLKASGGWRAKDEL